VVKPFGIRELVARIRAVVRRVGSASVNTDERDLADAVVAGPLRIDVRTPRVTLDRGGEAAELALTPKEFELLTYLAEDPGAVRSRTDIIERVWDANWFGPTKTVDAHVANLRRKLGDGRWIEAVRGVGFRLEVPTGDV
jgi:two-component system response regulator RegX3